MDRPRRIDVRPFPSNRKLVTAALRAGRSTMPMHGLLELDVTEATRSIARHDPPLSMTAFVIAAVARSVARHPEVHAYRTWRGRLVSHGHVDVSTIVEVPTAQGSFPLVHLVRDADAREVADISTELHAVKTKPFVGDRRGGHGLLRLATHVPGLIRTMYRLTSRSVRVRQRMGTVTVTAVGMFAEGGGFAMAPLTLMSLQVVVGGMSDRPRVIDGAVEVRTVLDLTVSVDHNIVDGAPAARFGAELRHEIETAAALRTG